MTGAVSILDRFYSMTDVIHSVSKQALSLDLDARAKVAAARASLQNARDETAGLMSIWEIAANVLGSEEVAVFKLDEPKAVLWLQWCAGVDSRKYICLDVMREPKLMCVLTGEILFAGEKSAGKLLSIPDPVSALIPIFSGNTVTGVIVIFRLLPQKAALNAVDREICRVLSTRAGQALQPMAADPSAIERDEPR